MIAIHNIIAHNGKLELMFKYLYLSIRVCVPACVCVCVREYA